MKQNLKGLKAVFIFILSFSILSQALEAKPSPKVGSEPFSSNSGGAAPFSAPAAMVQCKAKNPKQVPDFSAMHAE